MRRERGKGPRRLVLPLLAETVSEKLCVGQPWGAAWGPLRRGQARVGLTREAGR